MRQLNRKKEESCRRELDDNDGYEVVSVLINMKMSPDDGRWTEMTEGVWLNFFVPLPPLHHPGYQRSTAGEEKKEQTSEGWERQKRATFVST